jgi:ribosomal protein S12 methylthiotransferase
MEDVVREAEALAAEGCKELVLIAQDVTYYGKDLYGDFALPELLRRLCAARGAKSIEWIRLLYCYEERITDELIRAMASEPRILHYIDIPLQHIDADILRRMNRKSTPGSIRATIARLRAAMPDIVIRTAFITGLPGETEEAFEALCEFAEETRFGRLGVFAYSREEGTAAAEMPDQVAPEVAAARADGLMHVQQGISLSQNEALVGTVLDVIVDGLEGGAEGAGECEGECEGAGEIVYLGRTRGDAPEIDNAVIFTAKDMEKGNAGGLTGKIVKILVTDAMDYDLVGVVQ